MSEIIHRVQMNVIRKENFSHLKHSFDVNNT